MSIRILALIFLCFCTFISSYCFAQTKRTIYYMDGFKNPISQTKTHYYRTIRYKKDGTIIQPVVDTIWGDNGML